MTNQNRIVGEFFDKISENYDSKYKEDENRFLSHFFQTRIKKATDELPKSLGTVMDIGAGTGQLYSFLVENGFYFDEFIAVDISEGMLSNSSIPEKNRHVGTAQISALDVYEGKINNFFMLGVTTYMTAVELDKTLDRIRHLSTKEGQLILTFSNRYSVEFFIQSAISYLLKVSRKILGDRLNMVAAQTFPRLIISEKLMKACLMHYGTIERIDYINQTLTPVNRLFTSASIGFESFLARVLRNRPRALAVLSSDILFRVRIGGR